jgi:hypothetical protein
VTNFKNVSGATQYSIPTDNTVRYWKVLVEISLQGNCIRGAITVRTAAQEKAKKLAEITFINGLRQLGIWADTVKVDEPFEIETDEKDEKGAPIKKTELRPVIKYLAPDYDHVNVIDYVNLTDYDLMYAEAELNHAEEARKVIEKNSPGKKRRTTNEVAADNRKKKMSQLEKQEKQQAKVEEKQKSSVAKEEMLVNVLAYFLGEPKKIKDAAIALDLQYQKVRYSLFLIRDRGLNGDTYNLVETEIDGSKAFQLQKK